MLLGALLVLLVLGGAGPASAHAALKSTDPKDGSVLKSAPRSITLTFTESVGLLDDSFRVLDPDNKRVRTGPAEHGPGGSDTARVTLPAELARGTYVVAWRAVSADSHPVSGAFTFSVGKPSPTVAAVNTGPVENPATAGLYNIARYLAYLAAALLIGTSAFVVLCRPADPAPLRKPLVAGWWTLLGTSLFLLALRAPYETGAGPAAAFDAGALTRTLTGRPGLALLVRLALLLIVAAAFVSLRKRPGWSWLSAAGSGRSARPVAGSGGSGPVGAGPEEAEPDRPEIQTGPREAADDTAHAADARPPVAEAQDGPHGAERRPPAVPDAGRADTGSEAARRAASRPIPAASPPLLAALTAVAVALALTWAAAEHASAGIQVPLAMTSSVLHLLAMAVWLGGLTALLVLLHRTELAPAAVARFSRLAPACVTVLVVTGVYQSWRGLGSLNALTATTYGRLLLAKLAAVVLLLALAWLSRQWTARLVAAPAEALVRERVPEPVGGGPALPAPDGPAGPSAAPASADLAESAASRRGLRRSVLAEVTVGVVVLVVTTVLTGTLPGRAAAEAEQAPTTAGGLPATSVTMIPFDVGTPGGHGKVQITLDPGRVGDNSVQAVVFGPDGGISTVPELRLSLTLPVRKIGPIDARLTNLGGYWGTGSLTLPIAGTWTLKATVRTSDIDQVTVSRTVRITG
ncbi:copper resistance protein CopC [Streptomyces sp. CdTB01]|uniref:copper resistance CopC/CopD family protein n=1 Tax=Streptomyces sp. CdTB01 TaxID=1725411 RepID=UPI00073AB536|nr:copper resistance protein CopC [Streptomyces sp. CdTB01]ALV38740.1 transporter [Streptomyces sp. CdTB01]